MKQIELSNTEKEILNRTGTVIIRRRVNIPGYGTAYTKNLEYLGAHNNCLLFSNDEEGKHYTTNRYADPGVYKVKEYVTWRKCVVEYELEGIKHKRDCIGYAYRYESDMHYIGIPENAKDVRHITLHPMRSAQWPEDHDLTRYYVEVTDIGISDTRSVTQEEINQMKTIHDTNLREDLYTRYLSYLTASEVSVGCYSSSELRRKPLWWHLMKITLVPKETALETEQKGDAA